MEKLTSLDNSTNSSFLTRKGMFSGQNFGCTFFLRFFFKSKNKTSREKSPVLVLFNCLMINVITFFYCENFYLKNM